MLETLFGSVLTAGITAASFTVCLIAALALGALVAAVYMYKNTGTQSMAVTLALLPAMVQIIILLVNGNLGAGVAVSGAFGLVRFRSAPGSARDITCIFLAMTLGLATGMGYIGIAVMTGVVMCLLLLVYAAMSFGRRPEEEKELKITIPENLDYTGLFDDLFAQYTRASELVSVRTTGMGSLYNLHYHVTLVSSGRKAVPRRHPLPQRQSGHRLRQGSAGEGSALKLSRNYSFADKLCSGCFTFMLF